MDGFQGRLKDSLRLRLSLWLSLVIVGVALAAGVVSFFLAFNEAHELQDDTLRQTASLFNARHLPAPHAVDNARPRDTDPEARLLVTRVPGRAANPRGGKHLYFPPKLTDGLQTRTLAGHGYRIFLKTLGPDTRIAVAQQTAVRDEAAFYGALRVLLPFLILVPMLLIVVTGLIRIMFAPVSAVAKQIDQRSEQDLRPVPANSLPREIRPFAIAINRLLQRVAESMAMQQRFVAAAAHELRSPLTALSLQAERLAGAELGDSARRRVETLRNGIERNRTLLDQLLALAQAQAAPPVGETAISLQDVFRRVLEKLMPLAEAKNLDIGLDSESDIEIVAGELDLTTVVTNLVVNAIHYTPPCGHIRLSMAETTSRVELVVEDDGPGIPATERARVFEPFHRRLETGVAGSGLGLSIVQTIVDRLDGHIGLTDAAGSATGLRVTVVFPRPNRAPCREAGTARG